MARGNLMSTPARFTARQETKMINPHSEEFKQSVDLKSITEDLRDPGFKPIGSWAVHIYQSDITRQIMYKTQTNFPNIIGEDGNYEGVNEAIVSQSVDAAIGPLKELFRKKK